VRLAQDHFKRAVGGLYSWAAQSLYEPIVVRRLLPLLGGGDLEESLAEQSRAAVAAAGEHPILDMPVGTAHFALTAASQHRGLVVGVDLAAGMVQKAASAARAAGVSGFACVQGDAHRLPFPDASFGVVLSHNGLHVIPGLQPTVAELARVLVPGGRLYVSVIAWPASALLPPDVARRLPAGLMARRELVGALVGAGLAVTGSTAQRLAVLLEALKPVA
jgi:SAM-dependent methyltransferase